MEEKLHINLDATSMGWSACDLLYKYKVVDGYYQVPSAAIVYGSAVHEFIEVLYKTKGDFIVARNTALMKFSQPKQPPTDEDKGKLFLWDAKHFQSTIYNLMEDYLNKDDSFDLLVVNQDCWWCDNGKVVAHPDVSQNIPCSKCNGTGKTEGPAVELSFSFPFYEDERIVVELCGTIDKLGKFKNGCYAIGDYKITSQWNADKYLRQYEMHRQLRIYVLALRKMASLKPDSVLGKIGATNVGAFIDGIFLKSKSNENFYKRSEIHTFRPEDMAEFELMLKQYCSRLSCNVALGEWPKTGILNGTCCGKFNSPCEFWYCCLGNANVRDLLLKRDFKQKSYQPLSFRE